MLVADHRANDGVAFVVQYWKVSGFNLVQGLTQPLIPRSGWMDRVGNYGHPIVSKDLNNRCRHPFRLQFCALQPFLDLTEKGRALRTELARDRRIERCLDKRHKAFVIDIDETE